MPTDPPDVDVQIASLEQKFWTFHRANPHVYAILIDLAAQWIEVHGRNHLAIKMLFERARWEIAMETRDATGFKLNNNYTAFYARLMMEQEPSLAGAFSLRQQRAAASIGPDNETLPPGDHVV